MDIGIAAVLSLQVATLLALLTSHRSLGSKIDDTNTRIDNTNTRIDETNARIAAVERRLADHVAEHRI